jgi:hypothetical protein
MPGGLLRFGALLCAGVLVVHELRFAPAPLSHPEAMGEGHGYLALATPLIGLLAALGLAHFSVRWARRVPPGRRSSLSPVTLWLIVTAMLLVVYTGQELVEGALAPGHPGGLAGVFGHGGWVAVGLALVVGLGIVALLRGAETALARRCGRGLTRRLPSLPGTWEPREIHPPRGRPLARHLAGRAPPLTA